jgi:hypothetical protein
MRLPFPSRPSTVGRGLALAHTPCRQRSWPVNLLSPGANCTVAGKEAHEEADRRRLNSALGSEEPPRIFLLLFHPPPRRRPRRGPSIVHLANLHTDYHLEATPRLGWCTYLHQWSWTQNKATMTGVHSAPSSNHRHSGYSSAAVQYKRNRAWARRLAFRNRQGTQPFH